MADPKTTGFSEDDIFRSLIRDMGVAYAYFDANDRLQVWNAPYEALNYKIESMIRKGAYFPDLLAELVVRGQILDVGPDPSSWVEERLRTRGSGGFTYRHLMDGRIFLARERRMEDGGVLGVWIDVTAAHDKVNPAAIFARDVGHQLNNILQCVHGHAELARTAQDPLERDARLCDVLSASDEGADLSRLLLAAAGQFSFTAQPTLFDPIVKAALPADREIDAALSVAPEAAMADPDWLDRCVRAAVRFVVQAAPQRAPIRVATWTARLETAGRELAAGRYAALEIWTAHTTADPPRPTALEIAAVKRVAVGMGGRLALRATSETGRRARFFTPLA